MLELWILGLFVIPLIVTVLCFRIVRARRNWDEQMQLLRRESDLLGTELTFQHNQMHLLGDFVQQFNGNMSFSEGINVGLEALWHLPEIDTVAALLGEDELGPFQYVGIRGVDDPFAFLGKGCPLPLWGTLAHALVHRPVSGELDCLPINDIHSEGKPLSEEFPWIPTHGSLLVLPLRGHGKTIGSVILYSKRTDAFRDESRKRFLYAMVMYMSRALLEIRIQEQSARWMRHLVSLQLLTHTMAGIDSVERMLHVLREESTDMFGTVSVHLFLHSATTAAYRTDNGHSAFSLYSASHLSQQEEQFIHSSALRRLLSWVLEAEQPLFIDPLEPMQSPEALYYRETGHCILVPILGSRETSGGVLLMLAPATARPFDEDDLIVVRTIANSTSVALSNHRLTTPAALIPV